MEQATCIFPFFHPLVVLEILLTFCLLRSVKLIYLKFNLCICRKQRLDVPTRVAGYWRQPNKQNIGLNPEAKF